MDRRLFSVEPEFFRKEIEPIIERSYIWKGRPPKITHYKVFCAILYVLRTGIPWRDLPPVFGNWHTVFQRFNRGADRNLWWKILFHLQQKRLVRLNIVMADSTTFKVHRHGGGQKGGSKPKEEIKQE